MIHVTNVKNGPKSSIIKITDIPTYFTEYSPASRYLIQN